MKSWFRIHLGPPIHCTRRGSPTIASDPPGQNAIGDGFDLERSGGNALTVVQGGFGLFGHVYLNGDAGNLYVGATACDVAGSNNAINKLMMAMTTNNSTSVNPRLTRFLRIATLPAIANIQHTRNHRKSGPKTRLSGSLARPIPEHPQLV